MADAEFDPLAALEAEYAAVVAQSIPPIESSKASTPEGDAESAGSDSEREDGAAVGGFESYALLPSSPVNSDGDGPFSSDEDAAETEEQKVDPPKTQRDSEKTRVLEEDKRVAIMQGMQRLQLRPPPWAKEANLTDEQLVAMVQQQLQLETKPST